MGADRGYVSGEEIQACESRPRDRRACSRGRDGAQADDHPRYRSDHRHGADRPSSCSRDLRAERAAL